ncbi:MAG: sensor histidine kinase, partial [Cellulomonadaceae bacterium]|nr:sensor histidine kinase [Cellulomonadaceae bacterium]
MRWWQRVSSWDDEHRVAADGVAAVLTGMLLLLLSAPLTDDSTAVTLVTIAQVAPLAFRRSHPAASAAAVYTVALVHLVLLGMPLLPVDVVILVALYSVTVHGPRWAYRTAILGAMVGAAVLGAALLASPSSAGLPSAVLSSVAVALVALPVFAFALVRRSRRETIDALVDRARRLEVERDQQARIATAAERTRIAREMHDIVAHSLSVIIAQADGGRYAADSDPAAAVHSLATIGETGRAALADMRRLLGVLRPGESDADADRSASGGRPDARTTTGQTPVVAELSPQPAVGDVEHLVDQVRDAGARVSLVRMGTARALPPGTGLTVYRICQESLTNVLKHAGPSR